MCEHCSKVFQQRALDPGLSHLYMDVKVEKTIHRNILSQRLYYMSIC